MAARFRPDEDVLAISSKKRQIEDLFKEYNELQQDLQGYMSHGNQFGKVFLELQAEMRTSYEILKKTQNWPTNMRTYSEWGYGFIREDLKSIRLHVLEKRIAMTENLKLIECTMKKIGIHVLQLETTINFNTVRFTKLSEEVTELENKIRAKAMEMIMNSSQF